MPTALTMTPQERERYLATARRRASEPQITEKDEQERQRLLKVLADIAPELKRRFGIRRVVVFGSLAHAAWFTPASDVDVALEGAGKHYWKAWKYVEDMIPDRRVDVIDMDMASHSLRRAIERHGIDL